MLNEFTYPAGAWRNGSDDLDELSLRLAGVPCGPLYKTHVRPRDALTATVEEWRRIGVRTHGAVDGERHFFSTSSH